MWLNVLKLEHVVVVFICRSNKMFSYLNFNGISIFISKQNKKTENLNPTDGKVFVGIFVFGIRTKSNKTEKENTQNFQ